jgi:hypothetical protein
MHQFREEFRRWSGQRYGVKQITRMTRSAGGRVETIDRERLLRGRYWVKAILGELGCEVKTNETSLCCRSVPGRP